MSRPPIAAARGIDTFGLVAVLLACLCWGLNQVAIKTATEVIPPIAQAGWRSLLAAGLVAGWMWLRGIPILVRDGTLPGGLVAGLSFAADFALFYLGLSLTTAARGVLFLYLTPFLVTLAAHFFLPGERLTWQKSAGLLFAFAGLVLVVSESLSGDGGGTLAGDMLCLAAAVFWAINTLSVRLTGLRRARPERQLVYMLAISGPVMLLLSLAYGEPLPSGGRVLAWGAFAYTVVIVAFVSYIAWLWLLSRYRTSDLSAFTFLTPVVGVAAGHLLMDDPLTPRFLIALGLVVTGIILVNRGGAGDPDRGRKVIDKKHAEIE